MNNGPANPLGTGELARAFVCPQTYTTRFNPCDGLAHGTIFPELVSPYPGCSCGPHIRSEEVLAR